MEWFGFRICSHAESYAGEDAAGSEWYGYASLAMHTTSHVLVDWSGSASPASTTAASSRASDALGSYTSWDAESRSDFDPADPTVAGTISTTPLLPAADGTVGSCTTGVRDVDAPFIPAAPAAPSRTSAMLRGLVVETIEQRLLQALAYVRSGNVCAPQHLQQLALPEMAPTQSTHTAAEGEVHFAGRSTARSRSSSMDDDRTTHGSTPGASCACTLTRSSASACSLHRQVTPGRPAGQRWRRAAVILLDRTSDVIFVVQCDGVLTFPESWLFAGGTDRDAFDCAVRALRDTSGARYTYLWQVLAGARVTVAERGCNSYILCSAPGAHMNFRMWRRNRRKMEAGGAGTKCWWAKLEDLHVSQEMSAAEGLPYLSVARGVVRCHSQLLVALQLLLPDRAAQWSIDRT